MFDMGVLEQKMWFDSLSIYPENYQAIKIRVDRGSWKEVLKAKVKSMSMFEMWKKILMRIR